MIELKGRTKTAVVEAEAGLSILDHALKHEIDWSFACTRGTCARCRCLVTEGLDQLEEVTDGEWDRLEPEELEQGYRLGCQAIIKNDNATIIAANKPYF